MPNSFTNKNVVDKVVYSEHKVQIKCVKRRFSLLKIMSITLQGGIFKIFKYHLKLGKGVNSKELDNNNNLTLFRDKAFLISFEFYRWRGALCGCWRQYNSRLR